MLQFGHKLRQAFLLPTFGSSKSYWERRYRLGGTSGLGSYGDLAQFKAEVINNFVQDRSLRRIIEFGCGDGHQLGLANYPLYMGLDVSRTCVERCMVQFEGDRSKSFLCYDPASMPNIASFLQADLTLSLDVIYHLVEQEVFERHLEDLFKTSKRYVIVYSTDDERSSNMPHVRHRHFTAAVAEHYPCFRLIDTIKNRYPEQSYCKFFVFERSATVA